MLIILLILGTTTTKNYLLMTPIVIKVKLKWPMIHKLKQNGKECRLQQSK